MSESDTCACPDCAAREQAYAPAWVQSVTPAEIARQRAAGWPDFHPEDFCHRCGRRNVVWWVDSEVWNRAANALERGGAEILCPPCFVAVWQQETGLEVIWELRLDPRSRALREDGSR